MRHGSFEVCFPGENRVFGVVFGRHSKGGFIQRDFGLVAGSKVPSTRPEFDGELLPVARDLPRHQRSDLVPMLRLEDS